MEAEEDVEEPLAGGDKDGEEGSGPGEKREGGLKPWEKHATVISIPRFDYTAPSSLLERSHSGFLITCPIKREKSATKEAISILEKVHHVSLACTNDSEKLEPSGTHISAKKRKICFREIDVGHLEGAERNDANNFLETIGNVTKEPTLSSLERYEDVRTSLNLSLVKLTGSGLLLFTFSSDNCWHTVDTLSNIFSSLQSGNLKSPLWCHRIFPIQETCLLNEKDLRRIISKLVLEYLGTNGDKLGEPIKFAVGYNRRGIDETEMKTRKSSEGDTIQSPLLDREECFKVVAQAVKDVTKNSVVDLKSPEVVVLVELLPLSGVPHGSLVVGVSVLPHELVTTKPRLCVKSLVCDAKGAKRKG